MDEKELLKELARTVLSDITHMSEVHIKSKLLELAIEAERITGIQLPNRASDNDLSDYWEAD